VDASPLNTRFIMRLHPLCHRGEKTFERGVETQGVIPPVSA
jgi:hypothetical protein